MAQVESQQCSHQGCICRVSCAGTSAERYCSDGCARGEGCSHPDCNCAAYDAPREG